MRTIFASDTVGMKCPDCGNEFLPAACIATKAAVTNQNISRKTTQTVTQYTDIHQIGGGVCICCGMKGEKSRRRRSLIVTILGAILALLGVAILALNAKDNAAGGVLLLFFGGILLMFGWISLSLPRFGKVERLTGAEKQEYLSKLLARYPAGPSEPGSSLQKFYSLGTWQRMSQTFTRQ